MKTSLSLRLLTYFGSAILGIVTLSSCQQTATDNIVTQRIQYDVYIESPNPEYDWWIMNIEGAKRETFIKDLMNKAYTDKLAIYEHFTYEKITGKALKEKYNYMETVTFQDPNNPAVEKDTTIAITLNTKEINKLRFMEEWTLDKTTMKIEKRPIGMAPIIEEYDKETGELRGNRVLFWLFYDSSYPEALK